MEEKLSDDNKEQSKKIFETTTHHCGEWLDFKTVTLNANNKLIKNYEYVDRSVKKKRHPTQDGVTILAILHFSQITSRKLIIIANFRPPVNNYVLEFPGGLVESDAGIEDALRELIEETGYVGKGRTGDTNGSNIVYFDPWKSTENSKFIIVDVDGDDEKNKNPMQILDESEVIKVLLLDFDKNLLMTLEELRVKHNYLICSELYTFALSLALF